MIHAARLPQTLFKICFAAVAVASCGPELTTPASTDISGVWVSPGPAAGMTNMSVTLAQAPDGSITGTYTVIGTPGLQFCPGTGTCAISGTVTGSNSVLQVFFSLSDAGDFTGQLIGGNELRGAMSRTGSTGAVQFTRP
jgi:hypothetical protein